MKKFSYILAVCVLIPNIVLASIIETGSRTITSGTKTSEIVLKDGYVLTSVTMPSGIASSEMYIEQAPWSGGTFTNIQDGLGQYGAVGDITFTISQSSTLNIPPDITLGVPVIKLEFDQTETSKTFTYATIKVEEDATSAKTDVAQTFTELQKIERSFNDGSTFSGTIESIAKNSLNILTHAPTGDSNTIFTPFMCKVAVDLTNGDMRTAGALNTSHSIACYAYTEILGTGDWSQLFGVESKLKSSNTGTGNKFSFFQAALDGSNVTGTINNVVGLDLDLTLPISLTRTAAYSVYSPNAELELFNAGAITTEVDGLDVGLKTAKVTISSAELLALHTTPKTLVAAPGAGKGIVLDKLVAQLDYNSAAYVESGASNFVFQYTNGSGVVLGTALESTAFIDQTADTRANWVNGFYSHIITENAPIVVSLAAAVTTGDSPVNITAYYRIVDFSKIN